MIAILCCLGIRREELVSMRFEHIETESVSEVECQGIPRIPGAKRSVHAPVDVVV